MFCSKIYRCYERNMCPFLCCLKSRVKVTGGGDSSVGETKCREVCLAERQMNGDLNPLTFCAARSLPSEAAGRAWMGVLLSPTLICL